MINNNTWTIFYTDMISNRKNVKIPDISYLDKTFQPPLGYPIEDYIPIDICDKFLKMKRYSNNFLMPGYEVYLNNGDLIDVSVISSNILVGSAPIVHAFNNFWKMIWENNIKVIMSLTSLIENNIVKADLYYRSLIGEFSNFDVLCVHTESNINNILGKTLDIDMESHKIKVLKFILINNKTKYSRNIYHLHYTGWPDMNVPTINDMFAILKVFSYLQNKDTYHDNIPNKSFIHCSAGIGRTGTLLVLCKAINHINNDFRNNNLNGSINLLNIILNYRSKRRGIVQTQQQMNFIVDFLSIYISKYINYRSNDMIIDICI
jgi:protein tyrosine phosphatase